MVNQIKIYIPPQQVCVNSYLNLKVGLFFDYALTDITEDVDFEILLGADRIIPQEQKGQFFCLSNGGINIKATYNSGGFGVYTDIVSFQITPYITFLNTQKIFNFLQQYLPQNVYNTANPNSAIYADMYATSELIAKLNQQLSGVVRNLYIQSCSNTRQICDNIFPNQYIENPSNKLLQFMYNLNYVLTSAPYDITKSLSQYIYLRKNINLFVYIAEFITNVNTVWLLGVPGRSELNYTTILGADPISRTLSIIIYDPLNEIDRQFYLELTNFATRICPASCYPLIDVKNMTAEEDGLVIIGMTYKYDPRIAYSCCIQYNENALEQTIGAVSTEVNIDKIIDFDVEMPIADSTISNDTAIKIIGTFITGVKKEITISVAKVGAINGDDTIINNYIYLCSDNITIMPSCPVGNHNLTITYSINNIIKSYQYQLVKE